jgi:hypothetical protein
MPVCLTLAFTLIYCSGYCSTLKMEAIYSSETSVDFQWTTQRYIPEHCSLRQRYPCAYAARYEGVWEAKVKH